MSNVPLGPAAPIGPASEISGSTAGVITPPPLIYLVPLALGLALQHWYPATVVGHHLALPLGLCGARLIDHLSAVLTLRRARTSPKPWRPTTAVVTTGPYRFSRNPIYLGFTLLHIGIGFWANSLWPFLLLPLVLIVMQIGIIAREEAYLERVFEDEYREYRRRVRRWL